MPDLTGEVAVVTGIAGRLGRVWARALGEAGAWVWGVDLPSAPLKDTFEHLIPFVGDHLTVFGTDVTQPAQVANAIDRVTTCWSTPSILVNAAGIDQPPGSATVSPADVFRVNVIGAATMIEAVSAAMIDANVKGTIVNIGSLYGSLSPDPDIYLDGWDKPWAYGASKAALHNLTRYWAVRLGPYGIKVNTLSPGGVCTTSHHDDFYTAYCERVPLGRMAEPDDLTGPLLFLASDASRYVTGQELVVDGGYTCL